MVQEDIFFWIFSLDGPGGYLFWLNKNLLRGRGKGVDEKREEN